MTDFSNLHYLKDGNRKQRAVYKLLLEKQILSKLARFEPVLVGTIPIGIDIPSSDIDIACYWQNKQEFINCLFCSFEKESAFALKAVSINSVDTVIATFSIDAFELEIFGQNVPVKEQYGYRHMVIENRILRIKGNEFRNQVIALKQQGFKTEPAFGLLLGLKGDVYTALLTFEI